MLDLSEGLAERGHAVQIATQRGSAVWESADERGLELVHVGELSRGFSGRSDISVARRLSQMTSSGTDILHLHSFKAGVLGRLGRHGARCRIFYTPHCPVYLSGLHPAARTVSRVLESGLARRTSGIIAVGQWEADGLRLPKVVCIRNGIQPQDALPSKVDRTRFVMIGRFENQKRPDLVVRALAKIPVSDRPVVDFIGDGANLAMVRQLSIDLGVADSTKFHGYSSAPWETASAPSYLLQMSDWEATPYTILEALGRGIPVISSDVGEASVFAGLTPSVAVSQNDPDHLAQQILAAMRLSDSDYAQLGADALTFANEHLSIEKMVDAIEALYLASLPNQDAP